MISIANVTLELKDLIDILIVSFILYELFLFIKGTYAVQVLLGLAVILLISILASYFKLQTINWILMKSLTIWVLTAVILFQTEIRKGLASLGTNELWQKIFHNKISSNIKEEIIDAINKLSNRKFGALIVIENSIGLQNYIETGVEINAAVKSELIMSIFYPHTALHDGAIIISKNQITAASCILPLTNDIKGNYGTRHRAAKGLSETSDATIIVISEETGNISIAKKGTLITKVKIEKLKEEIFKIL